MNHHEVLMLILAFLAGINLGYGSVNFWMGKPIWGCIGIGLCVICIVQVVIGTVK